MQKTFTFYNDGGHGWVKVSKALLKELGIADKVSTYSYQRGENAYLEEDCDASLLVNALKERGIEPKFTDKYSDRSKIRGYENYVYLTDEQEKELADLKLRMVRSMNWSATAIRRINNAGLETLLYWQKQYGF